MSNKKLMIMATAMMILALITFFAFADSTLINTLRLPADLKKIDYEAYFNDISIGKVFIPEGVEVIDSRAFYGCSNLESVNIPGTVKLIDSEAFYGCSSLSSLTFGKGVARISWSAFEDCSALTEITLPASLEYIHPFAFYGCDNLTTVNAPKGTYAYTWAVENGFISLDGHLTVLPMLYDGDVIEEGDMIIWDHLSGAYTRDLSREIGILFHAEEETTVSVDVDWLGEYGFSGSIDNDDMILTSIDGEIYLDLNENRTGAVREGHIVFSSE